MSAGANIDIEMLNNITSADLEVVMICEMVAEAGVNVQGFAENEAVSMEGVDLAVIKMGVDGFFAAGFKHTPRTIQFKMLASSPFLETIRQCIGIQKSESRMLQWSGEIVYPALGMRYVLTTGVLSNTKEMADARDALDDVTIQFKFRSVSPQNL